MDRIPLKGRSFLDIGFGQGLSLLLAAEAGAQTTGCDVNPVCGEVLRMNQQTFPEPVSGLQIPTVIGSILDPRVLENLRQIAPPPDHGYDIVHSWGVLHHTGAMYAAIANAASLVRANGYFILAIYNRHWTSPIWKAIKRTYCRSPRPVQQFLVRLLLPVIGLAKIAVTRKVSLSPERGMDFFHDVIDWVGGYPYEYANADEITSHLERLGFACMKMVPPKVPTGCNEFVFRRAP